MGCICWIVSCFSQIIGIISNGNKNKTSTESTVATPITTQFSTYCTSRPVTMMEVIHQLLTMSE